MARGRLSRRRTALGFLAAGLTALLTPAAAQAAVSCTFTPGSGALSVTVTNGTPQVTLGRGVSPNTDVLVDDQSDLSSPAVCAGGTPTLSTTSQITVDETTANDGTTLRLNFVNGRLEPGLGADVGTPEIEVTFNTDAVGADQLFVDAGTEAFPEGFRFGAVGSNLGGDLNNDTDVDDITVANADLILVQPGSRSDIVAADGNGSGSFTGPTSVEFNVLGSMGNDTMVAGTGFNNDLNGGPDNDTAVGGPNTDSSDMAEGDDSFDGGGSTGDFASYTQYPAVPGVTLNLA